MYKIVMTTNPDVVSLHFKEYFEHVKNAIEYLCQNGIPQMVDKQGKMPEAEKNMSSSDKEKLNKLYRQWNTKTTIKKTKAYFQKYVINENERNLLIARPSVLREFASIEQEYRDKMKISKPLREYWKNLLNQIYSYEEFSNNKKKSYEWSAGKFIQDLDIHACCYCNADVVYSKEFVVEDGKSVVRYKSALDHFYPKDEYPYLALSLYNLVPVCDRCNSKFKHDKSFDDKPLLNPYEESLSDYFTFLFIVTDPKDVCHFLPYGKVKIWYDFKSGEKETEQAINSLKAFHIEEVYNELYSFVIKDIMTKRCLLTTGYGKWLLRKLHLVDKWKFAKFPELENEERCKFVELLSSAFREEWKHRFFDISFNPKDINKRPFSKLTIDLAGDL